MLKIISLLITTLFMTSCGIADSHSKMSQLTDDTPSIQAPDPTEEGMQRFEGKLADAEVEKMLKAGVGPGTMYKVFYNQLKTMQGIIKNDNKGKFVVYKFKKQPYEAFQRYQVRFVVDIGCSIETYDMTGSLQEWGFRGSPLKLVHEYTYCTTR